MFDFSHLPQNAVVSEYVQNPGGYYIWNKPPNCRFVFMLGIGGGGGGAGGTGTTSTSSRFGGSGGGGGVITQALFLASSISNTLYIRFGAGTGTGGDNNTAGTSGSSLSIRNYSSTASNAVAYIQATSAFGANASGGAGGAGSPAITATEAPLINHAIYFISRAGRTGLTGSNTGSGLSTSIGTASPIIGGCAGGGDSSGVVYAGGSFASDVPFVAPNVSGGPSPAGDGSTGIRLPWLAVGGAGGAGGGSATGGRGGNGAAYGAGGGGGGSSGLASQGGRGGDGGPAYACIIAW